MTVNSGYHMTSTCSYSGDIIIPHEIWKKNPDVSSTKHLFSCADSLLTETCQSKETVGRIKCFSAKMDVDMTCVS